MIGIRLLFIVVLILLSAFFSGSEIAYASVNEARLRAKAENEKKLTARLSYYIYKNYDKALATILIGNNLVNIASSSIATVIVITLLGEKYAFVATVVMTVLLLIFGEITPKIVAKTFSEKFTALAAIPIRILMLLLTPIIFIVMQTVKLVSLLWTKNTVTDDAPLGRDDLESMISIAKSEGVFNEDSGDLYINALEFEDTEAKEVMTPRVDIKTFDINDPREKILDIAYNSRHSRIPVYEDSIDNIIGILHLNKLFKALACGGEFNIREMLEKAIFVSKNTTLNDAVNMMKEKNTEILMVSDEFGGLSGLMTMEDALEQLVGEIWDESDEITEDIKKINDSEYKIKGSARMFVLIDELSLENEDEEIDESRSVGGFVFEHFEEIPKEGSSFEFQNLCFTVDKMDSHRVDEVTVKIMDRKNHGFSFTDTSENKES